MVVIVGAAVNNTLSESIKKGKFRQPLVDCQVLQTSQHLHDLAQIRDHLWSDSLLYQDRTQMELDHQCQLFEDGVKEENRCWIKAL